MTEVNFYNYPFTADELLALAQFFRIHEATVPPSLKQLDEFARNFVYNRMTIAEAQTFYGSACKDR